MKLLNFLLIICCTLFAGKAIGAEDGKSFSSILKNSRLRSSKACKVLFVSGHDIKCKGITSRRKGTKYFTFNLYLPKPVDFHGKQLVFDAKTTTPKNLQAFYVRFYNKGSKKPCWSFFKWSNPVKQINTKIELAAHRDSLLEWEAGKATGEKASNITRIEFWIGSLRDNVPMDMYLSNFAVKKAPAPNRVIWQQQPQQAKVSAKVKHPCGFLKAADIERGKINIGKYSWAKELYQNYKEQSKFWMDMSDEQIKHWIPEGDAFFKCLCPNCFTQPEFAWRNGVESDGKSIKCTKCKHVFPSSKFPEKYSYTVKSPHGKIKTVYYYKGPDQMVHKENMGPKYHLSGAVNWAKLKKLSKLDSLAYIYALEGDVKYAEKVRKVLLRFAEVYPHYSPKFRATIYSSPRKHFMAGKLGAWKLHDSGRILKLANAYDITYNSGVYSEEEKVKIENGIFREYKWLITAYPPTKDWCANAVPAHMTAAAMCAAMLGDHDLMNWTLEGMNGFKSFVKKHYTRDGFYKEFTPAYTLMADTPLIRLIDILQGYSDSEDYKKKDAYKNLNIFAELPQVKQIFSSYNSLIMPNGKLPPINDSDYSSKMLLAWLEFNNNYSPSPYNTFLLKKEKRKNLWYYYYSLFKRKSTTEKIDETSLLDGLRSAVFAGPGWAVLRHKESAKKSALLLNFNEYCSHWHYAILNYLYYDFKQELVTDLGYLSWQHPHLSWLHSPLAHNGVIVDGERQQKAQKTQLDFWSSPGSVQMVSASAPACYPNITKEYNRTIFSIQLSPERQYIADFFKVAGGKEHLFSFHADGEEFKAPDNLKFKQLRSETLGNKDIGWTWLKNSRACSLNDENVKFVWTNKNNVKSILYWPVDAAQEIILADAPGARFRKKPYDKTRINIMMSRKKGPDNVFVCVLEATKSQGLINEVTYLKTKNNNKLTKAVQIRHSSGSDIIVVADKPASVSLKKYPQFKLEGKYAVVRLDKANKLKMLWLADGKSLRWNENSIGGAEKIIGTIVAVDKLNKKLITNLKVLPEETDYHNNYLVVPGKTSGEYHIKNIKKENNKIVISIDKREIIDLQSGDQFFIPIHKQKSFKQ